eukprot:NODE_2215_length_1261_cov_30.979373_g2016_i0.p1 GENE.NODE_2215_length_1261_cov_30.979373_g2016_i0~~NODE_2215_length_1261_cov_30.979373_g2016_i0.p1  ORF type:complete len:289 (-),score=37.09 NODE_2215_length_1261_cov_30.979373_g2016_i0:259-1125(-)
METVVPAVGCHQPYTWRCRFCGAATGSEHAACSQTPPQAQQPQRPMAQPQHDDAVSTTPCAGGAQHAGPHDGHRPAHDTSEGPRQAGGWWEEDRNGTDSFTITESSSVGLTGAESSRSAESCASSPSDTAVARATAIPRSDGRHDLGAGRADTGSKKKDKRRVEPSKYKTKLCCRWSRSGACSYGTTCCFAHGESELRAEVDNVAVLESIGEAEPSADHAVPAPESFASDVGLSTRTPRRLRAPPVGACIEEVFATILASNSKKERKKHEHAAPAPAHAAARAADPGL